MQRLAAAIVLVIAVLTAAGSAWAEPVLAVDGTRETVTLLPRAEIIDPEGLLSPADAATRLRRDDAPIATEDLSHGFTNDLIWGLVTLQVTPEAAGRWYLSLELPNFDRLQVFTVPGDGSPPVPLVTIGDKVAPVTDIRTRFQIAPIDLAAGTTTLLFRGDTTSTLTLDIKLRRLEPLLAEDASFLGLQLFYLGVASVLGLGALGLFAYTRQRIFLIYVVNLIAHCMVWLTINGTGPGHLWPQAATWLHITPQIFVALTIYGTAAFARNFLASSGIPALALHSLSAIAILALVLTALGFVLPESLMSSYADLVGNLVLPAAAFLLLPTAVALIRGNTEAWSLMLTWVALIAAVAIGVLRNVGVLPNNAFTLSGPQLGSVAEMIIFAYMLIRRLGHLQEEKELVQAEALAAARAHRDELEQRVADRTAELDAAVTREREARRLQQQFVAMVSHDFRTPLAIVDASAQNFSTRTPDDLERLEKIRTATGRLRRMVDACLVDERVADGEIQLQRRHIDLAGLVDALVEMMRPAAQGRRVTVTLPDEPLPASVDPGLLEMAVSNIIENAFKYASPGSAVEISVARTADGAEIAVIDAGPGVAEADRERIFERHYRGEIADGKSGLGIGLHLVRSIVGAHGGRVVHTPTASGGSRFSIHLPLSEEHPV